MLRLSGFDAATGKITDLDGGIVLLDRDDNLAASWGFWGIIAHWNRKHAHFSMENPAHFYVEINTVDTDNCNFGHGCSFLM